MSARVLNKEREQYPLIKWSTRFEENASLVYTDKPTLQIIFNKIIDNCYKYFDHNKVNNYISITSNVSLDKNSVIVSIEDNGIGIEESAQDKIFDVFYIATERGGAGLGLFHARLAAEKIGISILNTNRKSPTIFEVHIPLQAKFRN